MDKDTGGADAGVRVEVYCQLVSVDNLHSPIELLSNETLFVGRGPITKIATKKCSRRQAELTANFESREVNIKVVGKNPSKVADKIIRKGAEYVLGAGGRFELISGYSYCIFFGERLSQHHKLNDCAPCTSVAVDTDMYSEEIAPSKKIKLDNCQADCSARHTGQPKATLKSFFGWNPSAREQPIPVCHQYSTLILLKCGPQSPNDKIAAFDLDSTLIETISGRKFPIDNSDWKLMTHVNNKLKQVHKRGYRIIVFTNQSGISKGKPTKEDLIKKMSAVAEKIDLPLLFMVASSQDVYRKPCTGMWDHFVQKENGGITPDPSQSFYVGDAAGRYAGWKHGAKKDFSCTDRKFASNINIPFETPEEFFLGSTKCTKFSWGEFDPRTSVVSRYNTEVDPADASLTVSTPEVVVFVGFPASGKTTFYETIMKSDGYVHVNRDTLGSWQKCVALCEQQLLKGRKVVIDNTNPDVESRNRYISCAQKHCVPVRCFHFMTTLAQAKHNNKFRELTTNNDNKRVTEIAFNTFKSRFVQPSTIEGFSEVLKITLHPCVEDKHLNLYKQFLL